MLVRKERSAPPCFAGVPPAGVFAALRLLPQEVAFSGGAALRPPPASLCLGAGALPPCHVDAGAAALADDDAKPGQDAADDDAKQLAACGVASGVAWRGEPRLVRRASAPPGEPAAAAAVAVAAAVGRVFGCGVKADPTPLLGTEHERLPLTSPLGSFDLDCQVPAPLDRLAVANGLREDDGCGVAAKGLVVVAARCCRCCGDGGAARCWGGGAAAPAEEVGRSRRRTLASNPLVALKMLAVVKERLWERVAEINSHEAAGAARPISIKAQPMMRAVGSRVAGAGAAVATGAGAGAGAWAVVGADAEAG